MCTNGTTIRIAPPVGPLVDSNGIALLYNVFLSYTGYGYMEIYSNSTTKTFYTNGSVALFNSSGFVRFIIPPTSIYVQEIVLPTAADGTIT